MQSNSPKMKTYQLGMQHFHSTSAMEGNFEMKLHEFLNTENEQHMNNLLMAFAPCQQLCWRKWSLWSPPGHQEVKDRQRDHRTPFCEATPGLAGVGASKHHSYTVPKLLGLAEDPFPPLSCRNSTFHALQVLQGGGEAARDADWEWRAHGPGWHQSCSAAPGAAQGSLCQEAAAAPTPTHLLLTCPGTNSSLFPITSTARAVSPHSPSSAPQLPHQVSYLPPKDLRTSSGTCKQLTHFPQAPTSSTVQI